MADPKLQSAIDEITNYIRTDVAGGFKFAAEIIEEALAIGEDLGNPDLLRVHARRILRDTIAVQHRLQEGWPAITDFDRLHAAFVVLDSSSIVCRHNFSCCGNCASAEIWNEIAEERNRGRKVRGCVHYDMQDTACAVHGHGLWLSYGSVIEDEQASVDIGHEIADALSAHGFEVEWNGSLRQRIGIKMDWKRRLSPEMLESLGYPQD